MRIFALLFLIPSFLCSQEFKIAPKSSWVEEIDFKKSGDAFNEGGAIKYFILDYQDNVDKEEEYVHIAYQVLNDEGVQNYSSISVDFDPIFQNLIFHEISIFRDGKKINKLSKSDFNTIRRESDMNRFLYDGSLTSYTNLTDIRANDIVEYSYTRTGFNPIFEGNYSGSFYQDFSVPVDVISIRILSSKKLYFEQINEGILPERNANEYKVKVVPNLIIYEDNTPSWHIPYRTISVSSFKEWSDVAKWATPLYYISDEKIQELSIAFKKEIAEKESLAENVYEAIRFVQDEIRYLGFESGIKGYKPSSPQEVFDRRFGDCKDKSNLLVGILSGMGVEAYPMLVHSSKEQMIDAEQPSPTSFDHCVVNFNLDDKDYYVDPTINNQGGDLDEMQFPNYKRGLVLKSEEKELRELGFTNLLKQRVKETLVVKDLVAGGEAELEVETSYFGASADFIRNYFDNNNISQISKEYTSYYSNLYRDIVLLDDVKIIDNTRASTNKVVVLEKYLIDNFWEEYGEGGIIAEAYPLVIEGMLGQKVPTQRVMPYFISQPIDVQEEITLIMPEEWNVTESNVNISGEGFKYFSKASGDGDEINILFSYQVFKSFITPQQAGDFLIKREEILNDLSFNLTYNEPVEGFIVNWTVLLLSILSFILSTFISVKIFRNFNPIPEGSPEDLKIGGWLVLLAIGLSITPIRMVIGITELAHYWNANTWTSLELTYDQNTYFSLGALILTEVFLNIAFLIYSILIIVLFFSRRSSAPRLISIFLISNLVFVIFDAFAVGSVLDDNTFSDSFSQIAKGTIFAILWVMYLNMSDRARNTFTKVADDS